MRLTVNMGQEVNNIRTLFYGEDLLNGYPTKIEDFHLLNEVMIDRGPSPYSVQLDIYVDGH